MIEAITKSANTLLFGKECKKCAPHGVSCVQVGLLNDQPGEFGQTVIYINTDAVLRTTETIEQCPAITGEKPIRQVAAKLKQTAKIASRRIVIDQIGNN